MKRQAILLAGIHVVAGFLFLSPSYIRPDSVGVLAWLRSLVVDGDLLFFNEWAGFQMLGDGFAFFKEVTPVGALANHWWVGTSMVTAPVYVLSHTLSILLPGDAFPADGFFGLNLAALGWTSVLFHALALALAALSVRQLYADAPRVRLIAAVLVFASLGTPAFWYSFRMPLGTHAAGMLLVGLLTYLCIRRTAVPAAANREEKPVTSSGELMGLDGALLLGLVFGLATVTRLQHAVMFPAVLYSLVKSRSSIRDYAAAAGGAALPILVQGAAWFAVYGNPLGPLATGANLEGVTWILFRRIAFVPVLFSSWRGLFVWSPVWIPALVGLVLLARDRDSSLRRHAGLICLLMFAAELFANATLDRYWWGGMSFGPRRFVDLAVPAAIGILAFIRRTRRTGLVVAGLATAWSSALMFAATAGTLDLARYVDRGAIIRGLLDASSAFSFDMLRSPVTSPTLAMQSCVAIVILVIVMASAWILATRRPSAATGVLMAWTLACLVAAIAAIGSTRARADAVATQFGLKTEAARSAGPLIDQRGLISDELVWLEATRRKDEAARTREEIARIDEELKRLGIDR